MLGTFGGALEARQIDASNGKLTAEVTGEVETEDNVLVIRRACGDATGGGPGAEGQNRARSWHVCYELPAVPDFAQSYSAYVLF